MGIFGQSFKKELGKNTGKWASTKLFGDKHATPHRIIYKSEAGGRGSSSSAPAQPKQPGLLGGIGKGVGDMMGGTMSMMQAELKQEQEEKALKREEKARALTGELQPDCVLGSPPHTPWSLWNYGPTFKKMDPATIKKMMAVLTPASRFVRKCPLGFSNPARNAR